MTASQIARAERRRERIEQEHHQRIDIAFGAIFLILVLAAFAVAGTLDVQSNQAWRDAWYEENGVISND